MMKKVCVRAIIPVAVAVTGFVVVCCLLLYTLVRDDLIRDGVVRSTSLADTLVKSTRYAMLKNDRDAVHQLIGNVGEQQGVEHVRVFNQRGLIAFSTQKLETGRFVDKNTAGCNGCHSGGQPQATLAAMQQARHFTNAAGAAVLGVTAAIYNEPVCSGAACHAHPPGQEILGILDVGLDQTPLQASLARLRVQMLVFAFMVLCLTVGGVAALLCRDVFGPLQALSTYSAELAAGRPGPLPTRGSAELNGICEHLQQLDQRCRAAEALVQSHGKETGRSGHEPDNHNPGCGAPATNGSDGHP